MPILYTYKDHIYEIIDVILTKDQTTRDWVTHVLYKRPYEKTLYSRLESEFHQKFKQVEDQ